MNFFPVNYLLILILMISRSTSLPNGVTLPLARDSSLRSSSDNNISVASGIFNVTTPHTLSIWPKLPYWTKIRNTDPPEFLDIYTLGAEATPREAYELQELVLFPLGNKIHAGSEPAGSIEETSHAGMRAVYTPNPYRPPSREAAARAVAALTFLEKTFGTRAVSAGLRLGMVRVAGIEVTLGDVTLT